MKEHFEWSRLEESSDEEAEEESSEGDEFVDCEVKILVSSFVSFK